MSLLNKWEKKHWKSDKHIVKMNGNEVTNKELAAKPQKYIVLDMGIVLFIKWSETKQNQHTIYSFHLYMES